jgi:hypothetical protein
MKLTEEQYGKLWKRHRALEIKMSESDNRYVKRAENITRQSVRVLIASGRWFTANEIAERLKCDVAEVEKQVFLMRKLDIIDVEQRQGSYCFRLKKEVLAL